MSENIRGYGQKLSYGEALQKTLKELHITQAELARGLAINPRLISRYVKEETMPSKETKQAIAAFISANSTYQGYQRMPSEAFRRMLQDLLNEFQGEITQRQLGEVIGKTQNKICYYTSGEEIPDTKLQYELLTGIYRLATKEAVYTNAHLNTLVHLEELLGIDYRQRVALLASRVKENYKLPENLGAFIPYMLSLPEKLRDVILEHFEVFYDDKLWGYGAWNKPQLHGHLFSEGIKLFRALTEEQQAYIVSKLEPGAQLHFPQKAYERAEYRKIASYMQLTAMDLQALYYACSPGETTSTTDLPPTGSPSNPDQTFSSTTEAEYIRRMENLLTYPNSRLLKQEEIIEEIAFKLTQTPYEWYVSMLLYIYHINSLRGNNWTPTMKALYDEMSEMAYGRKYFVEKSFRERQLEARGKEEEDALILEAIIESHRLELESRGPEYFEED